MVNGWQAAVVDWDRARDWYAEKLKCSKLAELIDKRAPGAVESGELCWIAAVGLEKISLGIDTKRVKMAYVWRHDKQEYAYVILEALHPLVSEKDVVEMSLKFHEDYGEKMR